VIEAVGNILEPYIDKSLLQAYGIGGVPKHMKQTAVNHCYPLNGNAVKPNLLCVKGVTNCYKQRLADVEMTGPKLFGSVLSKMVDPQEKIEEKDVQEVEPVIYGNTDITEMISQGIVLDKPDMEDINENRVWSVNSAVREHPVYGGNAAYATKELVPGECVEWGRVHRAPEQFAGQ
jgi:hypothetical protein